jgi:iron complex outermembrane receptor protein
VYDQSGGALAGATVTAHGPVTRDTTTNSDGAFTFSALPPGVYQVSAGLNGFDPARRTADVRPGATASLSFTLPVALRERVLVSAAKSGDADIQSIPMAIGAISNEELSGSATRTIEQAAALSPSVTFTQNSTFGQLTIRGIGTNLVNAGGDPSSAVYLDGVYLARPAMVFVDLLDVERIEVLRGPQGTLYGRNVLGGALRITSKGPTNDVEAAARVTAGTLGEMRVEGRLSGALKRDTVMGSIAFVRGRRDGYVRDVAHPDHPLGGDDLTAGRGQVRWVVNRTTDVLVSTDFSEQEGTPLHYNKVLQVKPGFQVDNPLDSREVRTSMLQSGRVLQYGASARLTTALTPSTTLVSLTAFRRLDNEYLADADITELNLFSAHNRERQHQWSEELTVTHRRPRLTSIAGAFLFGEADHQTVEADQPQARVRVLLDPRIEAGSAAAFGQTTLAMTSALSATIGLRYTHEPKSIDNFGGRYALDAPPSLVPGSSYAYSDSIEHSAWTPKFGVEMKLRRNSMAYVSATRGFKSGGFNLSSTSPGRGFEPESAWSYEGGVKTELMNGRARVNAAVFTMDYANLQVQTPIGIGVFDIRNAASATISGVEVEGVSRIGGALETGGHVTWMDATYDRYIAVAMGGVTGDVAGNRLNNAPEWAGRLWLQWHGHLTASDLISLTADASAQSTVFYTPFNDDIQRQQPYALLGLRASYGPAHRRWSINGYVRNLTNTDYIMAAFATSPAAFGGRPGASRQIGLQFIVQR